MHINHFQLFYNDVMIMSSSSQAKLASSASMAAAASGLVQVHGTSTCCSKEFIVPGCTGACTRGKVRKITHYSGLHFLRDHFYRKVHGKVSLNCDH